MADMHRQSFKEFTPEEHQTWSRLFNTLDRNRKEQAVPMFATGMEALGITGERIPDVNQVNELLVEMTGWRGVPVEGLEGGDSFFPALAHQEYPIGNFIRNSDDLSYTPEPDVFHDLYGHIPFFVDQTYADFNQLFGEVVSKHLGNSKHIELFERLYWFTIEFGLLKTSEGTRIFGAGLLSSSSESDFSLSDKPFVRPFNLKDIASQEYRIDIFQEKLFLIDKLEDLYECLASFENLL